MKTKRNYWPLLFIGIFTFTFGMIVWTVTSAINTPVHEDESFLQTYHTVDGDFNKILASNKIFLKKYNFVLNINGRDFGLVTEDVFYSQRVLEKKSDHKDMLKKGSNQISINIFDKNDKIVNNALINFRVTKATNNKDDMNFNNESSKDKDFKSEVIIPIEGNWNITGTVEIDDGNKGYFYIKTNAI